MTGLTVNEAVLEEIERERVALVEALPELEATVGQATVELAAAGAVQDAAWAAVEDAAGAEGRMKDCPPEVMKAARVSDRAYTSAERALTEAEGQVRHAQARLKLMEGDPAKYLERKSQPVPPPPKSKKQTAADQGFPAVYLTERGTFKSGYDSKAAKDIAYVLFHWPNPGALYEFTQEEAERLAAVRPRLQAKIMRYQQSLGPRRRQS